MAFKSIFDNRDKGFIGKHKYRNYNEDNIQYRTDIKKDRNQELLILRIPESAMADSGLQSGDRVDILQDSENPRSIAIVGTQHKDGPKLSPANWPTHFESYEDALGKYIRTTTQFTIYPSEPLPRTGGQTLHLPQWEADRDKRMIKFTVPRMGETPDGPEAPGETGETGTPKY